MASQSSRPKTEIIDSMRGAYATKDMESFLSFFTDDVFYRPGAVAEVRGPSALLDYLNKIYANIIVDKMKARATWELADVVIYDYDIQITDTRDNRTVEFPCVDIFQFRGDRISEWRVYPLHPSFVAVKA